MSYRVLVVSAYPPSRSGGIAQDMMTALEEEGNIVDFFTMYSFSGQKSNQFSIYPEPLTSKLARIKQRFPFLVCLRKFVRVFLKTPEERMSTVRNHGYRIPHLDESQPPVNDDTLYNSLPNNQYDFVIIYVTERMITTPSFVTIYRKYGVPLLIVCMDMMHFTGGCYFFGDCKRFSKKCGKCMILDSDDENDQTHKNYLTKSKVYSQIQYAIVCNLYQKQFALQCGLFNSDNIFTCATQIDEDVFFPNDEKECRQFFRLPNEKKHIILARYVPGMGRAKGYDHLVRIINKIYNSSSIEERGEFLLALIGSNKDDFANQIEMDTVYLGYLGLAQLVKSYSAASVFISTSVDDAGPSMVNQSMMCGTPVVSFKIGTALEVTKEGVNGYMADNFDDDEFAKKVLEICRKPQLEYREMRNQTRKSALEMNSKSVCARRIIDIYENVQRLY